MVLRDAGMGDIFSAVVCGVVAFGIMNWLTGEVKSQVAFIHCCHVWGGGGLPKEALGRAGHASLEDDMAFVTIKTRENILPFLFWVIWQAMDRSVDINLRSPWRV